MCLRVGSGGCGCAVGEFSNALGTRAGGWMKKTDCINWMGGGGSDGRWHRDKELVRGKLIISFFVDMNRDALSRTSSKRLCAYLIIESTVMSLP